MIACQRDRFIQLCVFRTQAGEALIALLVFTLRTKADFETQLRQALDLCAGFQLLLVQIELAVLPRQLYPGARHCGRNYQARIVLLGLRRFTARQGTAQFSRMLAPEIKVVGKIQRQLIIRFVLATQRRRDDAVFSVTLISAAGIRRP
ncbi:hypothetical protein D3C81_1390380 [compost metagenome]